MKNEKFFFIKFKKDSFLQFEGLKKKVDEILKRKSVELLDVKNKCFNIIKQRDTEISFLKSKAKCSNGDGGSKHHTSLKNEIKEEDLVNDKKNVFPKNSLLIYFL